MSNFTAVHPLDQFFEKSPPVLGEGVTVDHLRGHAMVQVFAVAGKTAAVEKALGIKESPCMATSAKDFTALPLCPGEWMLISNKPNPKDFAGGISKKLKANGYVSEQSDARVIFRLSGPRVRELLKKGCRLDLHPSVAKQGWCAQTQIAQVGVIMHQVDDEPTYDLLVFSGFARHFAEWLHHSGEQLGIGFTSPTV